jgi:hypothetical protein
MKAAHFVFFATRGEHLDDPQRRFLLSPQDIALLNPNTKTCPIFRSSRDAELTKSIYRRVPILINEARGKDGNLWGLSFRQGLFNMSSDSSLFHTREELEAEHFKLCGNVFERAASTCSTWHPPLAMRYFLPLYEAKMLHYFDHRWATYNGGDTRDVTLSEKADTSFQVLPRYWVSESEVETRLEGKSRQRWILGWRDVCRSTDARTCISTIMPLAAVGDKFLLAFPNAEAQQTACLQACLSSFVFDYITRQKSGGTALKYFVFRQLPVLPPATYASTCTWARASTWGEWIASRVLELTYTAHDLEPFARDLGYQGPPFAWNVERRFQLRCELDAAFFHLYGLSREEAAYVLDTFPIVRRKDERDFGTYRTRDEILKVYDAMANQV